MTPKPKPALWDIFSTWLVLGIQSFGGGSSTYLLIHQACIKRGWVEEEEFVRTWALAQISPGINLVKLTILIGRKLRGWPGLIVGAGGLMLPSAAITVLMTAGFSAIRSQPLVQAAMRGVLPATIGLSLTMAINMAQPVLARAHKEGPSRLGVHLFILAAAALLMADPNVSPLAVLLLAGGAAILLLGLIPARAGQPQGKADDEPA